MINPVRFVWRTVSKSFVYFLFASGSLFLATAIFPLLFVFVHPAKRCGRALRYSTYLTFKLMNFVMWCLGLTRVRISREDREYLKNLRSAVVVANHPSLLDITILISFLPQADCIVNSKLFERPIVRLVVRRLFVPNSLDFGEILASCEQSLKDGNCLVIFPEGSRTKPGVVPTIRKGSARISLGTGFPVLPVHIGANDMRGLRKGDPFYRINRKGRYLYDLTVKKPIEPASYAGLALPIAAKKMSDEIYRSIFEEV